MVLGSPEIDATDPVIALHMSGDPKDPQNNAKFAVPAFAGRKTGNSKSLSTGQAKHFECHIQWLPWGIVAVSCLDKISGKFLLRRFEMVGKDSNSLPVENIKCAMSPHLFWPAQ